MGTVRIEAKPDYVLRLAKLKDPVGGLAEIVWNSLDAEARNVDVAIERNSADGIEAVHVEDDGHGMPNASCESYFANLGGSWKASTLTSPNLGLTLHGHVGHGRIKGFALGNSISWMTTAYSTPGQLESTKISAHTSNPIEFNISKALSPDRTSPGTRFTALLPTKFINRLDSPAQRIRLTAIFAPFCAANPNVSVRVDGARLDPSKVWIDSASYKLTWEDESPEHVSILPLSDDERTTFPVVRVIEWPQITDRRLALCDSRGIELASLPVGIQMPGVEFSSHILWDGFRSIETLLVGELGDPLLTTIVDGARSALREHLRNRDEPRRIEQVRKWKDEDVYPFRGSASTVAEAAERQVFDEVATLVARKLPRSKLAQKLSLRLLREAVSADPDGMLPVIDELFNLPRGDQKELERLLARTSLAHLVKSTAEVAARLDFIRALKLLVHETSISKHVKERSELHKILEREVWIFGDEYHLMVSDQSLTTCLRRHLRWLGRTELAPQEVKTQEGTTAIVDLMLGAKRRGTEGREHLIVELKAPDVPIGQTEVAQIKKYAEAVASDSEFAQAHVRWDFMIISSRMDKITAREVRQPHLPRGCLSAWDNNVRVWAFTWSEIIDECERRLFFYQDSLNHDPQMQHAADYLRRVHGENLKVDLTLLPEVITPAQP